MIVAAILYLFLLLIIISASKATLYDKFLYIFECLLIFGIPFVLVTNVGDIRNKLPLFNKKSFKFTVLGGIIVFIIISMGVATLDNLKSPEQKHLDYIAAQKSAVAAVNGKITDLGDIKDLTLDEENDVKAARKAYQALTSEQKNSVTKLDILVSAEKKITNLKIAPKEKAAAEKAPKVAAKKAADKKIAAKKAAAKQAAAKKAATIKRQKLKTKICKDLISKGVQENVAIKSLDIIRKIKLPVWETKNDIHIEKNANKIDYIFSYAASDGDISVIYLFHVLNGKIVEIVDQNQEVVYDLKGLNPECFLQ